MAATVPQQDRHEAGGLRRPVRSEPRAQDARTPKERQRDDRLESFEDMPGADMPAAKLLVELGKSGTGLRKIQVGRDFLASCREPKEARAFEVYNAFWEAAHREDDKGVVVDTDHGWDATLVKARQIMRDGEYRPQQYTFQTPEELLLAEIEGAVPPPPRAGRGPLVTDGSPGPVGPEGDRDPHPAFQSNVDPNAPTRSAEQQRLDYEPRPALGGSLPQPGDAKPPGGASPAADAGKVNQFPVTPEGEPGNKHTPHGPDALAPGPHATKPEDKPADRPGEKGPTEAKPGEAKHTPHTPPKPPEPPKRK